VRPHPPPDGDGRRALSGKRFSLRARARSFVHAGAGLGDVLATQHNARIHALATLAAVGMGVFFGVSRLEWCWLAAAIAAVWTAESLNTALEQLADAVKPEPHAGIGRAKDAAAGAVLAASLGALAVGLLVLGPHLWAWLRRLA
jgi:diacylglycerol kinase (ATP)